MGRRHLRQMLMGTATLTEKEKKRLWLSPTARAQYFEVREQVCREVRRRWKELNVTLSVERQVAADRICVQIAKTITRQVYLGLLVQVIGYAGKSEETDYGTDS